MGLRLKSEKSLANLGFSRLFTAQLIDRWAQSFGLDEPISLEDLLSDPDTATYLRRAAGADIRTRFSPRVVEQRAFNKWFAYFTLHPLPTLDGNNDLILKGRNGTFRLIRYGANQ